MNQDDINSPFRTSLHMVPRFILNGSILEYEPFSAKDIHRIFRTAKRAVHKHFWNEPSPLDPTPRERIEEVCRKVLHPSFIPPETLLFLPKFRHLSYSAIHHE